MPSKHLGDVDKLAAAARPTQFRVGLSFNRAAARLAGSLILATVIFSVVSMVSSCAWSQTGSAITAAGSAIRADEGLPRVHWQDARPLIGKTAFVSGQIVSVGHTRNVHFLDFSAEDRTAFKVVIFTDSLKNFEGTLEDNYLKKIIEVRGTVARYAGNPQIVVSKPEQIRVLDALPPAHVPNTPVIPIGDEMTVATYNVLNLFDGEDDPYRSDETTPPKPREELEQLAQVIRTLNADVLALEEVENRGYLQRFLDVIIPDMGYQHVVHYEGNDGRGIDVCLVSRIPVGQVVSNRHLRFTGPDGVEQMFQRDLLQVELLPEGGDRFEVWVVHLKSNSGGREAAEPIRLAEVTKIRNLLDERLAKDPQAEIALVGDFNDTLDSATLNTVMGSGERALQSFASEIPEEERISYNREPYREMIDFLLVTPALASRHVEGSYRILAGTREESGSDHNPVSVRIRKLRPGR